MVRLSKWISGAGPADPVTRVARKSIQSRLAAVWYYAPRAAKSGADIECVHQLRVSVRRTGAALRIYADLLPSRKAKKMRKRLRELRKAANDARDLDVLAERLEGVYQRNPKKSMRRVLDQIADRRRQAQRPLRASYKQAKREGFERVSRELVGKIRWRSEDPEPAFGDFARVTFQPLLEEFLTAGQADLSDVNALHQMRIKGKQVRYAMEMLAGAFEVSFRDELYPIFGEVQERLGLLNDHATAIRLFSEWTESAHGRAGKKELGELIAGERRALDEECDRFRAYWSEDRAAELAERFAAVLEPGPDAGPPPTRLPAGRLPTTSRYKVG